MPFLIDPYRFAAAGSGSATVVQYKAAGGDNITSVTLDAAPTDGNWLIAITNRFPSGPAAGWTKRDFGTNAGYDEIAIWSKQAGAGESATQGPLSSGDTLQLIVMWEVSGLFGSAWTDFDLGGNTDPFDNTGTEDYDKTPAHTSLMIGFAQARADSGNGAAVVPTFSAGFDTDHGAVSFSNRGGRAISGAAAGGVQNRVTVTYPAGVTGNSGTILIRYLRSA